MQPTSLASIGSASGLLALSGALGAQAQLLTKDDRGVHDTEPRGEHGGAGSWGGVWCDPPGSRQTWDLVVLGPGALSAPCALPTWVLPWMGVRAGRG